MLHESRRDRLERRVRSSVRVRRRAGRCCRHGAVLGLLYVVPIVAAVLGNSHLARHLRQIAPIPPGSPSSPPPACAPCPSSRGQASAASPRGPPQRCSPADCCSGSATHETSFRPTLSVPFFVLGRRPFRSLIKGAAWLGGRRSYPGLGGAGRVVPGERIEPAGPGSPGFRSAGYRLPRLRQFSPEAGVWSAPFCEAYATDTCLPIR